MCVTLPNLYVWIVGNVYNATICVLLLHNLRQVPNFSHLQYASLLA